MIRNEKNIILFLITTISIGLFFLSLNRYSFYRKVINIDVSPKKKVKADNYKPDKIKDDITRIDKININTADINSLTFLPGIGRVTALKIIEFRSENGKFKEVEDLLKVKGIGVKKLAMIKKYATIK